MSTELIQVSARFPPQLGQYLAENSLPEDNETLQDRVRQAALYFMEKLQEIQTMVAEFAPVWDNQEVAGQFKKGKHALLAALKVTHACFAPCQTRFSAEGIQRARVNAELNLQKQGSSAGPRTMVVPKGISHPELYRQLLTWREEASVRNGVTVFEVVPNATLREIVACSPTDKRGLLDLPGIGKKWLSRYGDELLAMIHKYRQEHQIESLPGRSSDGSSVTVRTKRDGSIKSDPSQTKQTSFAMYRSGKSISEIAADRQPVPSTIAGHLAHFVAIGEIAVSDLVAPEKVAKIREYFVANPEATLSESKADFGDKYDYGELRLVSSHVESQRSRGE